jgi:hypothetical protein
MFTQLLPSNGSFSGSTTLAVSKYATIFSTYFQYLYSGKSKPVKTVISPVGREYAG